VASDQRLLVRVALLYYEENLTQEEVAARLSLSRTKVVRLLQEARRAGIVQIRVHAAPSTTHRELERRLESQFGLLQAVLAAPARTNEADIRSAVAQAAAGVLTDVLRPGAILALASGTTMEAVVEAVAPVQVPGLKIVEAQGRIFQVETHHELPRLAQRLGGQYWMLPAPRELSAPEIAAALLLDPGVQQTLELGRRAHVLLAGVGAIPRLSSSLAHLPEEVVDELQRIGAVGEISARFFDRAGQPCRSKLDSRLVGLTLDDFLRAPTRIGVAFGEHKIPAMAGALAGGYINMLVTDVQTATGLLAYAQTEKTMPIAAAVSDSRGEREGVLLR
jgi:deoxyribonucleoside regulator